jgi:hypothetical protein
MLPWPGGVDLSSGANGPADNEGDLTISAAGNITLGSLNAANLYNMSFEAGAKMTILGEIDGLHVGTGVVTGSFVTLNTDIYYYPAENQDEPLRGTYDIYYGAVDTTYDLRPAVTSGLLILLR